MSKSKATIYCRVSSKEQEDTGYSLDAQEKLLKEYADKKGVEVIKIFRITESASGKQIRKTFNEMINQFLGAADEKEMNVIMQTAIQKINQTN